MGAIGHISRIAPAAARETVTALAPTLASNAELRLAEVVSRISIASCVDELGVELQRSLQDILDTCNADASVTVGLVEDNKLKSWSPIPPGASLEDFDPKALSCVADQLIRIYHLGSRSSLAKFSIGHDICKLGAIVVTSETPIQPQTARLVEALSRVCAITLDRIQLRKQLDKSDAVRLELINQLARASDEERAILAGDLHDGPLQTLATLGYQLQIAKWKAARRQSQEVAEAIDKAERTLRKEMTRIRSMMIDLVPSELASTGIAAALREYVCRLLPDYPHVSVEIEIPENGLELTEEVSRIFYRVAQEAIINALKHARAKKIDVALYRRSEPHCLVLVVQDDGLGFDPSELERKFARGHLGLRYMTRRIASLGGELKIRSAPGCGTRIEAVVAMP